MILPVKGATVSSRTCIRLRTLGLKELLMLKISFRIYLMVRAKQIFRCNFIVLKSRLREYHDILCEFYLAVLGFCLLI